MKTTRKPYRTRREGIIEIVKFSEVDHFLKEVLYTKGFFYEKFRYDFIFRGHSSDKYELIPKVLRLKEDEYYKKFHSTSFSFNDEISRIKFERQLLYKFGSIANRNRLYIPDAKYKLDKVKDEAKELTDEDLSEYWIDSSRIEMAMLAQHYGIHTRLLDWTYDIHVAIYFAVIDHLRRKSHAKNMAIWCIDNNVLEKYTNKLFHYERALLSNLYFINGSNYKIPNMAAQSGLVSLWQIKVNRSFLKPIDRTSLDKQVEERIQQLKEKGIDYTEGSPIFYKLILPSDCFMELYDFINRNGYNTASLFPDYYHIKETIEDYDNIDLYNYLKKYNLENLSD